MTTHEVVIGMVACTVLGWCLANVEALQDLREAFGDERKEPSDEPRKDY